MPARRWPGAGGRARARAVLAARHDQSGKGRALQGRARNPASSPDAGSRRTRSRGAQRLGGVLLRWSVTMTMTDREILRAARAILPLLDSLVGADAAKVRARLRVLLAAATGSNRQRKADQILELLARYPDARQWLNARSSPQPPSRKGVVAAAEASDVPAKGYWVIPIHFATEIG